MAVWRVYEDSRKKATQYAVMENVTDGSMQVVLGSVISSSRIYILRKIEYSEWKCNSCLPAVSRDAVGARHIHGTLTQTILDLRMAA